MVENTVCVRDALERNPVDGERWKMKEDEPWGTEGCRGW